MSSVKMRKCKVTYTIYPNKSQETSSSTSTSSEGLTMEKRRHKSTINLDVRYVVDNNNDCLTVQRLNLPPDTNAFSLGSYGANSTIDRSTSETSKSAPADFPVLSNDEDPLLISGASKPFWQEKMKIGGGIKQWRAIDLSLSEDVNLSHSALSEDNREVSSDELKTVVGTYRPLRASLRSSDSGMADSYHLNSSEINSCYKLYEQTRSRCTDRNVTTSHSESENDENKYEHQCICTSPFGSTPRQSSNSCNNARQLSTTESSSESSGDSDCEDDCSRLCQNDSKVDPKIGKRFTAPIPLEHQNVVTKVSRRAHYWKDREPEDEQQSSSPQVYTSGLYAHWWLKKKIPLSGLVEQGKLPWHGC